jgi:hypothetical protein
MMQLEDARTHVDNWLREVVLKTGKCSALLRNELAEGMRQRTIDVHAVYDEIGILEGTALRPRTGTKPPQPLRRELRGLMHKHYRAASMSSSALNQRNHWTRPENQARLSEIVNEFFQDGHQGKLAHQLVLGAHTSRHGASQMTGEWIVYAEIDGVTYYLTLGTHGEPDADIRVRVQSASRNSQRCARIWDGRGLMNQERPMMETRYVLFVDFLGTREAAANWPNERVEQFIRLLTHISEMQRGEDYIRQPQADGGASLVVRPRSPHSPTTRF